MNITQQLITINEAKQDIKAAIIEKGQTVADNMNEYAEAINNISGGNDGNTDYLCFEALEDNEISCGYYGIWSGQYPELEYSFDKQTWTQWGDYTSTSISMQAGQKLYLRGNNPNGFCESDESYMAFNSAAKVNLSGNIMSLIDKQCLSTTLINRGAFKALFRYVIAVDASLLSLPATSLSPFCYQFLFRYSTELINGPKVLPAITLEEGCYSYIF